MINLIMLVAAMHNKAWLAVGVNDKKRTELLLFSKKWKKRVTLFDKSTVSKNAITFDPKRFTRIQKHRYNRKTLLHRCIYFLGQFEVVLKMSFRP